ncbi:MAG TPA: cyclic dehypoxanthinyl futalosine synthase [Bacteroidales bacterium]|jgi:cyclic dehypoxanthinyl futalosine synthase|nr:dehypoxanthine futalosine cyclase [Bacteroidales bacterium]OQB62284.1 MAG: Aminodeoxyfutalosine synthase [Bacteroidetes bacterium ADurb.Bin145]NMD04137.1 dehypoxanthine futalosine cyclase [Bacteroidales bacterium]HOU02826.1 cyclic dehypoxanthinyl futalosine synthase [Bacteroidales bacterium]HQG63791.1 cyclic dehypoxanthinyl futalosine synthase [Bacteroidales bacterium]
MAIPSQIFEKAYNLLPIETEEGEYLYNNAPLAELIFLADRIRQIHRPGNNVGWIIDRNVNITNVCFSQCSFCNFCRKKGSPDAYITSFEEYSRKIRELYSLGGDQLLLQGGMNPDLDLGFYMTLFKTLKELFPSLKLHALGPPEIVFLAKKENKSYHDILTSLISAGLDSLPGAGAEILSDRVRRILSPAKATADEWSEVMRTAHKLNLPTSATMMYGHIETVKERIEHLIKIRDIQNERPQGHYGFITFIPWPFQDKGTVLREKHNIKSSFSGPDYLRLIAVSRIILNNINNIQSSVLTVGKEIGMLSLHSGANDVGSVMIEENVVSAAGSQNRFDANELQALIREAGFIPVRRNQKYEPV